jgi:hypothetical protein
MMRGSCQVKREGRGPFSEAYGRKESQSRDILTVRFRSLVPRPRDPAPSTRPFRGTEDVGVDVGFGKQQQAHAESPRSKGIERGRFDSNRVGAPVRPCGGGSSSHTQPCSGSPMTLLRSLVPRAAGAALQSCSSNNP